MHFIYLFIYLLSLHDKLIKHFLLHLLHGTYKHNDFGTGSDFHAQKQKKKSRNKQKTSVKAMFTFEAFSSFSSY